MTQEPTKLKPDLEEWKTLLENDQEAAFIQLIQNHQDEIFDLCVRICGNRSEAEDLTQETFIKAYENLPNFRLEANPRTWLYRIAINTSISLLRRWKRWRMQRGGEDDLFPEMDELSIPSNEDRLIQQDLASHAHQALKRLPLRQRTAVTLVVIKELSYSEAAAAMGISIGGVKASVHFGIRKLRQILQE